jgi:hypothetical protein
MLPNTLYGLITIIVSAIIFTWGGLKGWRWYLDSEEIRQTSKDKLELARLQENVLTAKQVADLMNRTREIEQDIFEIKEENKGKDEKIERAMDKLEARLQDFNIILVKVLSDRANRFEESLLK